MASRRQRQVAELIHRELSLILLHEVRDPRLATVTLTEVRVSPDLLLARAFYSVLGEDNDKVAAKSGLESATPFLRTSLAKRVQLRSVPELIFQYDASSEYGRHIDQLLDQIAETSPAEDE
jgi:ribosome-binding factor A